MNKMVKQLINLANTLKDPSQAIKPALQLMARNNPQEAKLLEQILGSGVAPEQAIADFAKQGKINLQQLTQLRRGYTIIRSLGLNMQVPQSVWNAAEEAIKAGAAKPEAPIVNVPKKRINRF